MMDAALATVQPTNCGGTLEGQAPLEEAFFVSMYIRSMEKMNVVFRLKAVVGFRSPSDGFMKTNLLLLAFSFNAG